MRFSDWLGIILTLSALMACSASKPEPAPVAGEIGYDLGISFPPVADEEQRDFTAPLLKDLGVAKIRIGENWSFREPVQGDYNWASLDERINWATENNLEVLLTIQSNGPDWACGATQNENSCVYNDNGAFRQYVEDLLQRYSGKIAKVQYGNEWMSDYWYTGNGQQYTEANDILYQAVQTYSPGTQVVLGGFTTISLRFLAGCDGLIDSFYDDEGNLYDRDFLDANCGGKQVQTVSDKIDYVLNNALYDEVDIHLYDDVENWITYYEYMTTRTDKPIIITEFGGPNANLEPDTERYQSEQLQKYIFTIDSMDVQEAYFFKLVEGTRNPAHRTSGLITNPELTKKLSYYTFKELND
ncbi:MAG: glycosyl hydrolase [Cyclobacteriaceae bacterium]